MNRMQVATLVLLVMALIVTSLSSQTPGDHGGVKTVQGCLQFTDGRYRLIDSSGVVHTLTGEANRLTHYVGQEVSVTVMESVRTTDTTQQGQESAAKERPALRVKSVKVLSSNTPCVAHK